jgi:hypothetical protein
MATIIDNDSGAERTVRVERTSDAGWAVAVIVLVVLLIAGAYAWARYHNVAPAASNPGSANINVTLPGGTEGNGSGTTGGGSSGGTSGGTSGGATSGGSSGGTSGQ